MASKDDEIKKRAAELGGNVRQTVTDGGATRLATTSATFKESSEEILILVPQMPTEELWQYQCVVKIVLLPGSCLEILKVAASILKVTLKVTCYKHRPSGMDIKLGQKKIASSCRALRFSGNVVKFSHHSSASCVSVLAAFRTSHCGNVTKFGSELIFNTWSLVRPPSCSRILSSSIFKSSFSHPQINSHSNLVSCSVKPNLLQSGIRARFEYFSYKTRVCLIVAYSFKMEFAIFIGGVGKLTHTNYNDWKSCLELHLQGQDLWDVVNGADITPPNAAPESTEAMRK
ncbi:hypothetical protein RJ640_001070 [Escallonia rubra]|uniref:DUF4219 domain-containing protein n=1 Tax=Escallonia rubra TaxID=112253 RepID=A0AA88QRI9_9ASTE|nr:hypothetical protein RJ640_001070 [Escallonia rubra]